LQIFRRRFIPDEMVDISKDEVLHSDDDLLVTRWKAIKPRGDIKGGISFAFLKKGYKISKFYDHSDNFCYWYCDIINYAYYREEDKYVLIDLLVDVKVTPDGKHKILDLDELAIALEKGIVDENIVIDALKKLDALLGMVDSGAFPPKECSLYQY
jgi:predicted RNA-binding protein associated with RNAse of E/G family